MVRENRIICCDFCCVNIDRLTYDVSKLRNCVKVELAVLVRVPNQPTVSVDVKQHSTITMSANGGISTFSFSGELESPLGVPFKLTGAREPMQSMAMSDNTTLRLSVSKALADISDTKAVFDFQTAIQSLPATGVC